MAWVRRRVFVRCVDALIPKLVDRRREIGVSALWRHCLVEPLVCLTILLPYKDRHVRPGPIAVDSSLYRPFQTTPTCSKETLSPDFEHCLSSNPTSEPLQSSPRGSASTLTHYRYHNNVPVGTTLFHSYTHQLEFLGILKLFSFPPTLPTHPLTQTHYTFRCLVEPGLLG